MLSKKAFTPLEKVHPVRVSSLTGFTLVELITVMVIFSVVMLAAGGILVSLTAYFRQFRTEVKLQQDAAYAIDILKNVVTSSEHVDIVDADPSTNTNLTLRAFNKIGRNTDDLVLDGATLSRKTYTYDAVSGAVIGTQTEVVSNCIAIESLKFSDEAHPNNRIFIRLLKIELNTRDPSVPSASGPNIVTSIACRLTANPAEDTVWNKTRSDRGETPNLYATIQAAVDGADLTDANTFTNELRCLGAGTITRRGQSFDGVFKENVRITTINGDGIDDVHAMRNIILHGSYDSNFSTQNIQSRPTTIDGRHRGSCVSCIGYFAQFIINGFRIQNGENGAGGGILVSETRPHDSSGSIPVSPIFIITDNIIEGNHASGWGGGIFVGIGDWPTEVMIANNRIANNGDIASAPSNCNGGGVYINKNNMRQSADCTISNNVITSNSIRAGSGGGIFLLNYDWMDHPPLSVYRIINNEITDNFAGFRRAANGEVTGGEGGGLCLDVILDTLTINNNSIEGNTGSTAGGGIRLLLMPEFLEADITNNTISGNTVNITGFDPSEKITGSGGGILCLSEEWQNNGPFNAGNINIRNNVVSGNAASHWGGGIWAGFWPDDTMGAGINQIQSFTLTNNIITGNQILGSPGHAGGVETIVRRWAGTFLGVPPTYNFTNNTIVGNTSPNGPCGWSSESFNNWTDLLPVQSPPSTLPDPTFGFSNTICHSNTPNNVRDYDDPTYGGWRNEELYRHSDIGPTPLSSVSLQTYISAWPVFVNQAGGDYRLQNVPANDLIRFGSTGEMGAYGNIGAGTVGYIPTTGDQSQTYDPHNYIREDHVGTY